MAQKTSLYDVHVRYGGKLVAFAGYMLPVQYGRGVIAEHMAVRKGCGIFDVSHMGEILCVGERALENLNWLMTNDFTGMYEGQARYSPMCNENGGIADDLIVYKIRENCYFIVVNASNKDKDFQWMKSHELVGVDFTDLSSEIGQIALQGPDADRILRKAASSEWIPEKYYSAVFHAQAAGIDCIISKTGYTGEDGYEIYMKAAEAPLLWEEFMKAGEAEGLMPCGLGARDTLRLEAAMPLYGHEMDDTVSPFEAGLSFAVKMDKKEFIGKEAMLQPAMQTRKRVGLKVTGRGIIREKSEIYIGDRKIGISTSGTHCPYLGYPAAMALLDSGDAATGTRVEAEVRGRRIEAEIVELPFYKRKSKKSGGKSV